jgi:hypothetical protein
MIIQGFQALDPKLPHHPCTNVKLRVARIRMHMLTARTIAMDIREKKGLLLH